MITYHLIFDDGRKFSTTAISAGAAIRVGLEERPGHRVTECYSGHKEPLWVERKEAAGSGYFASPAYVDYDVPPHKPLLYSGGPVGAPVEQTAFGFLADQPTQKRNRR